MSYRQQAPLSDSEGQLARAIERSGETADIALATAVRGGLPEPLQWRRTVVVVGPPPVYMIEIVNPLSGGSVLLAVI